MTGFITQTLPQLCSDLPIKILACGALPEVEIHGITADSREVQPGFVFVAVPGLTNDGHRFIPQAIAQGAVAVVGSERIPALPVPYIQVEDPRLALAHLAASFYGRPARGLTMIGVTGTDGKTTTANLIYHILLSAGLPAGIISTVNAVIGTEVLDTGFHVTTPQSTDVQRYLARMKDAGLTHVVLEVTSHGLVQQRVAACEFEIGVVTNITHEHLDFHGSYEAYRAAKASLLTGLAQTEPKTHYVPPLAVINYDDSSYDYLHQVVTVRQAAYSIAAGSNVADVAHPVDAAHQIDVAHPVDVAHQIDAAHQIDTAHQIDSAHQVDAVWADQIHHQADGLHFVAHGPGFSAPVYSPLMGRFNVSNCLAALAATVLGLGIDPRVACQGIAGLRGVPGRMEQISMGQSFIALVDFAHTPNALEQALKAVREMTNGRVIAVFGSAGLRDREKRRMMAEVAAGLADFSVLTAEDPRTESLENILEEMAVGARARGGVEDKTFARVPDRGAAIRYAVRMARPGDLVVACGKGHEQSMCFGTVEYPWDDRVAMRAALAELLNATGPRMPYLPTQDQ